MKIRWPKVPWLACRKEIKKKLYFVMVTMSGVMHHHKIRQDNEMTVAQWVSTSHMMPSHMPMLIPAMVKEFFF